MSGMAVASTSPEGDARASGTPERVIAPAGSGSPVRRPSGGQGAWRATGAASSPLSSSCNPEPSHRRVETATMRVGARTRRPLPASETVRWDGWKQPGPLPIAV
jgi:hypothetical protein